MKQYTDIDLADVARVKNSLDPVSAQDLATKAYVDATAEGIAWKDSCRVASTANVNISSPGATIDSISLSANDRVLLKDQSTASQNGIYVWNGAAVAMTRANDASTTAELEAAVVTVEEGTANGGSTYRQTQVNFTIDSGTVAWSAFGTSTPDASESTPGKAEIATQGEVDAGTDDQRFVTALKLNNWSGRLRKVSADIGDGSATQYDVSHNLNTRDIMVQVRRVASPYDQIGVDIEMNTVNVVRIKFASAPASGAYRVTVIG